MKNDEYVYVSFALHRKRDSKLIEWLNSQPNKTGTIRNSLAQIMRRAETNDILEILNIVRDLQSRPIGIISNGNAQQETEQVEEVEPQDISDSLDDLWR